MNFIVNLTICHARLPQSLPVAAHSAGELVGADPDPPARSYRNAFSPVRALPSTSVWTSWVPS